MLRRRGFFRVAIRATRTQSARDVADRSEPTPCSNGRDVRVDHTCAVRFPGTPIVTRRDGARHGETSFVRTLTALVATSLLGTPHDTPRRTIRGGSTLGDDEFATEHGLITVDEAARVLHYSTRTVFRLLHDGTLPRVKHAGHTYTSRRAVDAYLAEIVRALDDDEPRAQAQ